MMKGSWQMDTMFMLICVGYTTSAIKLNRFEQRLRRKYSVNYDPTEINYDPKTLIVLVSASFFAGGVSGCCGIGGGCLYLPLLMALGVSPQVARAVTMHLVLVSSLTTCFISWQTELLDFGYAACLGIIGGLASVIGLTVADLYIKRTGKSNWQLYLLCALFFVSIGIIPLAAPL